MVFDMDRKLTLYKTAYVKNLLTAGLIENTKDLIKKNVFYGIKAINHGLFKDESLERFDVICLVHDLMKLLTPREFMTIFNLDKVYDGNRYECKDYYTAMQYINTLNLDEPIGENIEDFLWEYVNRDIRIFNAKRFTCVDDLRVMDGKRSMLDEFLKEQGIGSYKKFKDHNGKEFLLDSMTGKTHKILKKRYLKVLK
jgi:hypothetical protein